MGGWVENNKEKDHGCTHEQDFIASQDDRNELFRRSDEKFKTLEFIKGELILIKDALGVKNKDNGTRDRQIKDIMDQTSALEKLTDEHDSNLNEKVIELSLEFREIKGLLTAYFRQKEDERKIEYITKKQTRESKEDEHIESGWWNDRFTLYSVLLGVLAIGIGIGLAIHFW